MPMPMMRIHLPNKSFLCLGLLMIMFTSTPGPVGAGLVDVDFIGGGSVTVTGAGAVGDSGDQWNGITTYSSSGLGSNIALDDTSGQTTGISLSYTGAGPDGGPFFSPIASPNPNLTSTYTDSYTGSNPNNVITMSLTGLMPGGSYDLYVYDVADYHVGTSRPGVVALDAANGGASAAFYGNGYLSTWIAGGNYVLLSGRASSNGDFSFSISPSGGNHEVDLNGFQLVSVSSVPEPSSLVMGLIGLMTLGGAALARRRARY